MSLDRTPLFDWHTKHGGRMVEFGGWEMPVQYSSIVDEHQTVRKAVGLFDISHMGRLSFKGRDAKPFLDRFVTCNVETLADGQIRYGLVCNENGGILDDILVNRVDETTYGLVVNASNRIKIIDWISTLLSHPVSAGRPQIVFQDQTKSTAMIAIQGPHAATLITAVTGADVSRMKYYTGRNIAFQGMSAFLSRTGYTGEDGFELIVPEDAAVNVWDAFVTAGAGQGIKPCGLGCRDTLRLEAAMPLYGHELSEQIDPLTAGLDFAVKLEKPDFIGKAALQKRHLQTDRPVRVGLKLESRRIAREHSEIYAGESRIGEVTSGTFSPTLEQSIAMGYVNADKSQAGCAVEIDIRGKREPAVVVPLPFYRRSK